jgi:predicted enzyme related to lactoylglutathione lyase
MNKVIHFEIPVDNVERAKKFYSDNFSWEMVQMGNEYGNYVLLHTGPTDKDGIPKEK